MKRLGHCVKAYSTCKSAFSVAFERTKSAIRRDQRDFLPRLDELLKKAVYECRRYGASGIQDYQRKYEEKLMKGMMKQAGPFVSATLAGMVPPVLATYESLYMRIWSSQSIEKIRKQLSDMLEATLRQHMAYIGETNFFKDQRADHIREVEDRLRIRMTEKSQSFDVKSTIYLYGIKAVKLGIFVGAAAYVGPMVAPLAIARTTVSGIAVVASVGAAV
eukprot:CAMPEP_0204899526 /NCGR_PEP_ID=MMETSP1397-20131031/1909_1 /ASSEMBLY_ACC=CAM_ASM_000891 /TAXON_ID=49980 /ORGANISM="Climacostomum Climacostomum virens, Strain Stock W-24" /LENGTH=217 /DNA_ID=CAMNT_0052067495 /DNA_START=147 /DNA_END=797 /DNA_ORIENTATION=-